MTVTDHGSQGAVPRQIKAAEDNNLGAIFGIELYLNPYQIGMSSPEERRAYHDTLDDNQKFRLRKSFHLLAIAFNEVGYSNLVRLSSWGYIYGWGGRPARPRVNYEQLMLHKEGIIFTSCCYASEIGYTFDTLGEDAAMDMIAKYISMFGENYRLEIMMLDFVKQKPYDRFIIKAHEKFGIPIFLSQDCHFSVKEHGKYQRYQLMIQTGRTIHEVEKLQAEGADLFELQDQQLWMKSEEELNEFWSEKYSDAIDYDIFKQAKKETVNICEKAKGVKLDRSNKLPVIPDEKAKLAEAVLQGYKWRHLPKNSKYQKRIIEELDLINRKGFASYFLIQKQMTDEARRICPELIGFGDGSEACGPGRGCNYKDNRIILKNGTTKPIIDVKIGDLVYTHDGSIQEVTNTFVYDNDEPLLKIKSYYGDGMGLTLTKDHLVYAEKMQQPKNYENRVPSTQRNVKSILEPTGDLKWTPAEELSVGDWVFIPKIQHSHKYETVFDLGKFVNGDDLVVNEDYVKQFRIDRSKKSIEKGNISERFIRLDEEWACLLGIFAADGWLVSGTNCESGFVFHENELDSFEFIRKILNNYGFNRQRVYHNHYGKKCTVLFVNSRFLYFYLQEMFNDYKHTPETKHVPDVIMNSDKHIIEAFLHGYHLGDGSLGEYKTTASSVSRRLIDQVRLLLLKLNIPSSIGYEDCKDDRPDFKNTQPSFILRTPKNEKVIGTRTSNVEYVYRNIDCGILTRIRSIEEVHGIDKVYDLEVANSHSFLTSSFVIHNSAVGALTCYCLGITDVDPIKHDLLFSRFLSEARGGKTMRLRFNNIDPVPIEDIKN